MGAPKKYNDAVDTWQGFNDALMSGDLGTAKRLLKREQRGNKRPEFIRRAYARVNKLRADKERAELLKGICDET